MCVVVPRLSWQGRRCALPLHPSSSGASLALSQLHTIGENSLSPTRTALRFFPHWPTLRGLDAVRAVAPLNHDKGVCRPCTLHIGFAQCDDQGRACPLEPGRLRRGDGTFLLPSTPRRRAFQLPLETLRLKAGRFRWLRINPRRLKPAIALVAKIAIISAVNGAAAMTTMSAKDAKNAFGLLLDKARAAPVIVEKHGRAVVVVLSVEEYDRLNGIEADAGRLRA